MLVTAEAAEKTGIFEFTALIKHGINYVCIMMYYVCIIMYVIYVYYFLFNLLFYINLY